MLKRPTTSGQNAFYVYLLMDWMGTPAYVGKGSGRRLSASERRFGLKGIILSWHLTDERAFKAERAAIAKLEPFLNKCPGGNGGVSRVPSWLREIEAIGTREYARRLCLAYGKSIISPEDYELLKNAGSLQ
jgi:hypothetical protein